MVLCVDSIESVGWFENNRREDWKVKELVGCLLVMFVLRIMFWGEERGREILSIPRRVKSSIYRKKKKKKKEKKQKGTKETDITRRIQMEKMRNNNSEKKRTSAIKHAIALENKNLATKEQCIYISTFNIKRYRKEKKKMHRDRAVIYIYIKEEGEQEQ